MIKNRVNEMPWIAKTYKFQITGDDILASCRIPKDYALRIIEEEKTLKK